MACFWPVPVPVPEPIVYNMSNNIRTHRLAALADESEKYWINFLARWDENWHEIGSGNITFIGFRLFWWQWLWGTNEYLFMCVICESGRQVWEREWMNHRNSQRLCLAGAVDDDEVSTSFADFHVWIRTLSAVNAWTMIGCEWLVFVTYFTPPDFNIRFTLMHSTLVFGWIDNRLRWMGTVLKRHTPNRNPNTR